MISALEQTFKAEGHHADKVLERIFKGHKQIGGRDRRFIAETTYECVRWWRYLWISMGRTEPSLDQRDLFQLVGAFLILRGESLPDWPEFRALDANRIQQQSLEAKKIPAVRESVPDWMYEIGRAQMGEAWDAMLAELNRQAPVVLRANRLKTTREELKKRLLAENEIETRFAPEAIDGLVLNERSNIFTAAAFKDGWFEVQDGASQQVASLLAVEPGHRVIDACAGAGGKTLHMAALMKNKGKIIAMDIHPKKLDELRKRCTRASADIVETKEIESQKTIKRLEKSADRVLLDVPCSGLGVLRRNPDSKWKLSLEEIERLNGIQAEILRSYSDMVKPGGRLVYATCSCLPSENEQQVEAFLSTNADAWTLLEEKKFSPGFNGYDGFYAALLERRT